jgi:hypothetical protein
MIIALVAASSFGTTDQQWSPKASTRTSVSAVSGTGIHSHVPQNELFLACFLGITSLQVRVWSGWCDYQGAPHVPRAEIHRTCGKGVCAFLSALVDVGSDMSWVMLDGHKEQ